MKRKLRRKILWLILVVLFLLFTRKYLAQPFFVLGKSMEPTLKDRRICLVNKAIYHFKLPERGEVVVFRTNEEPHLYFTKRIVGLPGEIIEIRKGRVFIDGRYYF
ncbi:MAG: signal peptidase I [bacterium (Candidatus Ratteibacteria) CG_4_10_14_3_um_filter_41_18]|uniref:Signal peptidase I n=4 Tax=Candidatus Ratteibacteria TaxID=2979319 RepID=A0A2M7YED3_9BACT|nr:MAG: signal peptidase I [Candidatus Omnitrophica bacterium CG1_02_41_171]PIV64372.1 MAG: signal peptidase I [bacterium (Candidatus Ratteibacteria) CG01_land_8_20_14_3_00_40_19]PIW33690.1 MAG: signal peptidase I [bacterium (Candidatus Ratteibacteria) CG15_BIG_FIL_POST_REV_8_21_14_020_41_12]PIW74557.1 MAG: signal peptidase I [bacterium (Candidatus Ratteibacteria) CG_4_8_14_3_um_filter_41_36]PIX77550.1 MAG: signal peptidase I [bacterium (Candidatus Ratteibacteria) CG_4_10_14_3_um_filter_41_18]